MIDLVAKNFKKVTLVYNGANAFQFDFLSQYPQIKSVLWCPPAGQTGFSALGEVLAGDVDPSGKTSDTFVKDLTKTAGVQQHRWHCRRQRFVRRHEQLKLLTTMWMISLLPTWASVATRSR